MTEKAFVYIQKGIFKASRIGTIIGAIILNVMIFLVVLDVIMRKSFASPIRGSLELSEIFLGMTVFLGLAFCAIKDEHVVIDLITERLSKSAKAMTMAVIYVLSAGVSCLMSWRLFTEALSLQQGKQVTILLGIWLSPFVFIAFLSCALLTLVFLMHFLNTILAAKK